MEIYATICRQLEARKFPSFLSLWMHLRLMLCFPSCSFQCKIACEKENGDSIGKLDFFHLVIEHIQPQRECPAEKRRRNGWRNCRTQKSQHVIGCSS